ncbi:MAG TPA: hypothetical protein PLR20_01925 [Syntrophales bacterium]|nr:hypothetical protein [Syntrophales bacterium]HPI57229.1 hypothetical protein [Syntrophales bacterium]HPN23388.1 hypothetical protein [Syntrophales bacterium]HQM28088.1 hypothetical protein [Syntrophales bacterium]
MDSWIKKLRSHIPEELAENFSKAQHEHIAHRIFGCEGEDCSRPQPGVQKSAPSAVLDGVCWNDAPPFTLPEARTGICPTGEVITIINYPECWGLLFMDAKRQAEAGRQYHTAPGTPVLYRSHFGDMQFLHSMASSEKELADETKQKIMAWAKLMYGIALGEVNRSTSIRKMGLADIESLFTSGDDTIHTLFVNDKTEERRGDENLRLFAMGVLIHMVSDSFTDSHVERDEPGREECKKVSGKRNPGSIRSFRAYSLQDSAAHGKAETDRELSRRIHNLTDVGRNIMEYYSRKAPWEELEAYLDCVYDLSNPAAPAGPGAKYRRREPGPIFPGGKE